MVTTKAAFLRSPRAYLPPEAQLALLNLPRRREFLLAQIGPAPKRVLDVGCATGYIARMLMHAGHQVTGLELNPEMAARARDAGVDVVEHDLEEPLPLPTSSVDAVHACEVIEHVFDTEGFLTELHRVLVTGGVLILSTPNLNSLGNRFRVLLGRPVPMWGAFPGDRHGGHIRVFNRDKIEELLRRTRFRTEIVTGINQGRWTRHLDAAPTLSELLLIKAVTA